MKKAIVITTINKPTEAVRRFSKWSGWDIVVVGDQKSPDDWACERVTYLDLSAQKALSEKLSNIIPRNTYTRKMLGYVFAAQHGAEYIFETDDDNLPYGNAQAVVEGYISSGPKKFETVLTTNDNWLNIYRVFGTDAWPRGYPIERVASPQVTSELKNNSLTWGVLQFLADEDPDVDAIYRMIVGKPVRFRRDLDYLIAPGKHCPTNSQATLWPRSSYPLLYLPLGVPDRVTDILRGLIVNAAIWADKRAVAYASPIVYQDRNLHNLHRDFLQESLLYRHVDQWAGQLADLSSSCVRTFYENALCSLESIKTQYSINGAAYKLFLEALDVQK